MIALLFFCSAMDILANCRAMLPAEPVTMTGENIGASHTRQKDNEFIAANTTLDVTLTEVATDGLTHFVKHFIPK